MRGLRFVRGERRRWASAADVSWHIGRQQSGRVIVIPAGREFESSVPWALRWLISQDDPRFLLAALIHDVMLEEGIYGRPQAAAEWFDAALAGGAPRTLAKFAYVAVAAWAVFKTPKKGPEMSDEATGLVKAIESIGGGVATSLIGAFIGRFMYHSNEARAGRRRFFGAELIWEIPVAVGMAIIGEGLASYLGLTGAASTALIAVLAYLGPRGTEAAIERWFSTKGGKR